MPHPRRAPSESASSESHETIVKMLEDQFDKIDERFNKYDTRMEHLESNFETRASLSNKANELQNI